MHDSPTLVFNLSYAGTLDVALLMILGPLAAFTALLAIAATAKLLIYAIRRLVRLLRNLANAQGYFLKG